MKILAVIPARSGSKGVPHKNVKTISGVPLLAFSAWTAIKSNCFDEVLVSTENPDYLAKLEPIDYQTDYLRPEHLADDASPSIDVLIDALAWYERRGKHFDAVMLLQPTSPFRSVEDIQRAIQLYRENPSCTAVTSVVRVWDHHPRRLKIMEESLWLRDYCEHAIEPENTKRQDFRPEAFLRNGAIYLSPATQILNQKAIRGNNVAAFEMSEECSVNIDRPIDFVLAETLFSYPEYESIFGSFNELKQLYATPSKYTEL